MNYYVVDSVKGGCGKTAIAIWKALDLRKTTREKVCYIDMDLLGTSIESFLRLKPNKEIGVPYLSELFSEKDTVINEKCLRSVSFTEEGFDVLIEDDHSVKCIDIGMIFSSPFEEQKKLFKSNFTTHYYHHVDYDFFSRRLNVLFDLLKEGDYKHIVIDMPPNSDSYTDSVFDLLLDRNKDRSAEEDNFVKLLLVSTFDRAHITANTEWLSDKISTLDHNWKYFDEIELILNDNKGLLVNKEMEELAIKQSRTIIESGRETKCLYNYMKQENKNLYISYFKYNSNLSNCSIFDRKTAELHARNTTSADIDKFGSSFKIEFENVLFSYEITNGENK